MLVNKDSLIVLLSWLRGNLENNKNNSDFLSSNKFRWEMLSMKTLSSDDNDIELSIKDFEDIMIETLPIIKRLKNVDIVATMKSIGMEVFLDNDMVKKEMDTMSNYENIVHELFVTELFNDQLLINYQINYLKEKLEKLIRQEKYEECSVIQAKLEIISE